MSNLEYYSFDRKEIFAYIPSNITKTLDVGCGVGYFSAKLKEERTGIETWGIEMQPDAAQVAKTKLDRILVGSFDDVFDDLPTSYFDCVFFNDVLEHLPYPEMCLTQIKTCMHPNGKVVASIPNMRYIDVLKELLFEKDWRYKDSGILDKTHLRFFTKKSIIRMFGDCGYKVEGITGINGVGTYCLTSILNRLLLNSLDDIKYKQFLVVASPIWDTAFNNEWEFTNLISETTVMEQQSNEANQSPEALKPLIEAFVESAKKSLEYDVIKYSMKRYESFLFKWYYKKKLYQAILALREFNQEIGNK